MILKKYLVPIFFLLIAAEVAGSFKWPSANFKQPRGVQQPDNTWNRFWNYIGKRAENDDKGLITDAIRKRLHNLLETLLSSGFPTAVANASVVSSQCIEDSLLYVHSVYNFSLWALQSKFAFFCLPCKPQRVYFCSEGVERKLAHWNVWLAQFTRGRIVRRMSNYRRSSSAFRWSILHRFLKASAYYRSKNSAHAQ